MEFCSAVLASFVVIMFAFAEAIFTLDKEQQQEQKPVIQYKSTYLAVIYRSEGQVNTTTIRIQ